MPTKQTIALEEDIPQSKEESKVNYPVGGLLDIQKSASPSSSSLSSSCSGKESEKNITSRRSLRLQNKNNEDAGNNDDIGKNEDSNNNQKEIYGSESEKKNRSVSTYGTNKNNTQEDKLSSVGNDSASIEREEGNTERTLSFAFRPREIQIDRYCGSLSSQFIPTEFQIHANTNIPSLQGFHGMSESALYAICKLLTIRKIVQSTKKTQVKDQACTIGHRLPLVDFISSYDRPEIKRIADKKIMEDGRRLPQAWVYYFSRTNNLKHDLHAEFFSNTKTTNVYG